eukprot:m.194152 g.194152  ORF g.194152 m.194152 type:complete len:117 (-) comp53696_c0_seq9:928-1278(-)
MTTGLLSSMAGSCTKTSGSPFEASVESGGGCSARIAHFVSAPTEFAVSGGNLSPRYRSSAAETVRYTLQNACQPTSNNTLLHYESRKPEMFIRIFERGSRKHSQNGGLLSKVIAFG